MHEYLLPRVVLVSSTVTICFHSACFSNLQQLEMQPYRIDNKKTSKALLRTGKTKHCVCLQKITRSLNNAKYITVVTYVTISHRERRRSTRMAWRTESLYYYTNISKQTNKRTRMDLRVYSFISKCYFVLLHSSLASNIICLHR